MSVKKNYTTNKWKVVWVVIDVLQLYAMASGQYINLDKSSVFPHWLVEQNTKPFLSSRKGFRKKYKVGKGDFYLKLERKYW